MRSTYKFYTDFLYNYLKNSANNIQCYQQVENIYITVIIFEC